jgi:NAD(P)-dependent dehydrogenase (short-subunit alcohol dehydrogenase family)
VVADLSAGADLDTLLDRIDVNWSEQDALIHAAATDEGVGPAWELPVHAWQENLSVNLLAAAALVRRVASGMIDRRSGVVLAVISRAARVPLRGLAPYCVSKAALGHYVVCLADELAPYGVRANALGVSFHGGIFNKHRVRKAASGYYRDRAPSDPPPKPVESNLAPFLFLTSDAGRHVTGQCIECCSPFELR